MSDSRRSSTPAPRDRRSRRSMRTVAAVALLVTALVAGVTAIVAGTVLVLGAAVLYALVAGSGAARLLADETGHVRREWARDRASIAHQQSREALRRQREHVAFAEAMANRVRAAEAAVVQAEARAAAETERADGLEGRLTSAQRELVAARAELRTLNDELAASRSVEVELRTQLVAWEQRDESRRYA